MFSIIKKLSLVAGILLQSTIMYGQEGVNYDEAMIPPYTLPELLVAENGKKIGTVKEWEDIRRPEIVGLYENLIFGKAPNHPADLHFRTLTEEPNALNGMATRREIAMSFSKDTLHFVTVLLYIPNKRTAPAPLFVGLNFKGNHTISHDQGITITETCLKQGDKMSNRGAESSRWPVEMLIENGYGVATIHNSDIEPDSDNGFQHGLHPLFYAAGQVKPKPDEWGTLAAWAFGLRCAMDYFVTDTDIDARKVAVVGHSRNGKAALWAGVLDKRFAMVISNNSGCGGAALFNRRVGETVQAINKSFPYWFCENFKQYNNKEENLPVDQHQLIALMAPRPIYVASAVEDRWADPKGEFLASLHASPVYQLYGVSGLGVDEMPEINTPVATGYIGYHIRDGKHDIKLYDWQQYVKFADRFFK